MASPMQDAKYKVTTPFGVKGDTYKIIMGKKAMSQVPIFTWNYKRVQAGSVAVG